MIIRVNQKKISRGCIDVVDIERFLTKKKFIGCLTNNRFFKENYLVVNEPVCSGNPNLITLSKSTAVDFK